VHDFHKISLNYLVFVSDQVKQEKGNNKQYHMTRRKPIRARGMEAAGKRVRPWVEGHGAQAEILFNADVPSAGRAMHMAPPVKSGSLPAHNLLTPHLPHSVMIIKE